MSRKSNTEDFIKKALIKHNGVFTYDNVIYVNNSTKVLITCKKHGDFLQTPSDHLSGYGCAECKRELTQVQADARKLKASEEFSEISSRVHSGVYDYSKVHYVSAHVKVDIICKEHGVFQQTPHDHKQGNGCRSCGIERSNIQKRRYLDKPTKLYYVYFKDLNLWKIGCTMRSINTRFRKHSVEIIEVVTLPDSLTAYTLEMHMLRGLRQIRYKGDKVINGGDTELLVEPIDFIERLGDAYVKLLQYDLQPCH